MNGLTQFTVLTTITKKMYIIYRKLLCFVHVRFIANQAALEKNAVPIESVAFFSL